MDPRPRNAPPPPARRAGAGFTLLELVAVIGIIAVMSLVVVGGFNGIIRAVSRDTGGAAIQRALNIARQQACVDGEDAYVWVTGIDSYAIVRKAGTLSDRSEQARDFSWGNGNSLSDLGKGRALWVFDDYADLSSMKVDFGFDDTYGEDDVRAVFDQYRGLLAFDMTDGTMANVIVPPMYAKDADSWVFGVEKNEAGTSFKAGDDYGWLVLPEQILPKGYAFDGSFDSNGAFRKDYDKKVRFAPTGVPDAETTFTILELATGATETVKVTGNGKVEFEKPK